MNAFEILGVSEIKRLPPDQWEDCPMCCNNSGSYGEHDSRGDIEEIFTESLSSQKAKKNKNCVDDKGSNKRINPQILEDMIKAIEKIHSDIIDIDDETADIERKYALEEFYSNHDKLENLKRRHLELEMQKKHKEFELEKQETEYLERCEK